MKRAIAASLVLSVWMVAVAVGQGARTGASASADFVGPGPVVPLAAPIMAAVGAIRAEALAAHIAFLAAPSLEGRGLGGSGLDASAEYIAASLSLAGVPPLDAGAKEGVPAAYFQPVPLREISHPSGQVVVETRRGDGVDAQTFLSGVDCVFPEMRPEVLAAPAVFAGYGIRETSPAHDDYRGLDVKDKVVLIFGGLPDGAEWQKPDLVARYSVESGRQRHAAKLGIAAALGARAVLAVEDAGFATRIAAREDGPAQTFFLPFDAPGVQPPPLVRLSPRAGDAALTAAGLSAATGRSAEPRALPGVTITLRISGDERLVVSRNVVGVIRGSDPKLRDQAIVIGAHFDHLGRSDGTIFAGADDNASGTAAVLEMARAFAASPVKPKRTLVFAFWTGEEEGRDFFDGYHEPSDTPDKLDAGQVQRMARLAFVSAWLFADR